MGVVAWRVSVELGDGCGGECGERASKEDNLWVINICVLML